MNLLLDTQVFLWLDGDEAKLSAIAGRTCSDTANTLWLSVASAWEMQIKITLGKLRLSRSRNMSARIKSRSSAESFSECCFCKCAGCVVMNSSSTNDRSMAGNISKSTPRRMSESKFIVSFDEML